MKKVDYYAMNQPWKMPKWLGFTLGGIFGAIVIASGVLILQLTHSATPPVAAAAAALPVAAAAPAQPAAVAEPAAEQPKEAVAAAAPVESAPAHHGKHHDKHARAAKATKVAAAKRPANGITDAKAHAILAKHDDKSKRHDKDALDKLLGL